MKISEHFRSLQGEGPNSGHPALFIRFSKCNLFCNGSWICDTQEIMKRSYEVDLDELLVANPGRVVITGGEPLLYQEEILQILNHPKLGYTPVEIETNGTVEPCAELLEYDVQYNVSPKLSGSGMPLSKRYQEHALAVLAEQNSCFKFVVSSGDELEELRKDFSFIWDNYRDKVWLMPAGESREKLAITAPMVAGMCILHGVKFSNRQHIILWDTKKGV